ncbi:hypothetical protein [Brevibacillus reuszeri]|uniref:hypothetical protein n=1 Tax=Brevibacillus reuszeri TaxID=54915 RepID=UPI000CCC63DF|nr:hypothetical protein [Brevibacillus reuszeri]
MDKAKGGKLIGIVLLIPVLIGITWLLIKMMMVSGAEAKDLVVAFVGFSGSIIGGAITLLGVKITLNNQHKQEFMKSYPKKKKLGDDVLDISLQTWRSANKFYADGNFYDVGRAISIWLNNKDEILEKGSQVSDEVYATLRDILVTISEWDHLLLHADNIDEDERKERHKYYLNSLYERVIKLSSDIDQLEKEYSKIKRGS